MVLGTVGHVDHGKSSLLKCLTQMNVDRLPEEKRRGMTIDLNFCHLQSSSGEPIGIIDVPGHHKFVKNMVAGVASIDAFIFVVAADDGWMPQSEEHWEILRAFGISQGVAVITKRDLVTPERLAWVQKDVEERLRVPSFPFSFLELTHLDDIKLGIETRISSLRTETGGRPRLWIDRVFVPKGLGPVVTGTLREGELKRGDSLWLWPGNKKVQVRGIVSHKVERDQICPTVRAALRLAKVEACDLNRGMLLYGSEKLFVSRRVDARIEWFQEESIKKSKELTIHFGTLRLSALIQPLFQNNVRLTFPEPLPLRVGERFLLRSSGDDKNYGMGIVLENSALPRWRLAPSDYEKCERDAATFVSRSLRLCPIVDLNDLALRSLYTLEELEKSIKDAQALGIGKYCSLEWRRQLENVLPTLFNEVGSVTPSSLHQKLLEKCGLETEDLSPLILFWLNQGVLRKTPVGIEYSLGAPQMTEEEKRVLELLSSSAVPMSVREIEFALDVRKGILQSLAKKRIITSLPEESYVDEKLYQSCRSKVVAYLKTKGQATTGELREYLKFSRKNTVLLLEQMDRDRVTYLKEGIRRLM